MHDTALLRRQFLGGAGAVAVAMAAAPASASHVPAVASDGDAAGGPRSQADDRVALLCLLRSATARG